MNATYAIIARIHDKMLQTSHDRAIIIYENQNYSQIYAEFEKILKEQSDLNDLLNEIYSDDIPVECCIARINIQKDFQVVPKKNQLFIEVYTVNGNIKEIHRMPVSRQDYPQDLDSEVAIREANSYCETLTDIARKVNPDASLEFIRFIKD